MRVRRLLGVVAGLAVFASCQEAPRPDFVARVKQDCDGGSADACSLLSAMQAIMAEPNAPRRPRGATRSSRTQVQRDTEAIMQGVDRARTAPRPTFVEAPNDGSV